MDMCPCRLKKIPICMFNNIKSIYMSIRGRCYMLDIYINKMLKVVEVL